MNCLNTVGSGINKQPSDLIIITITGDGTYITQISSNKYIITFTGGVNEVSFNKNISSFNVIAIGGGGGGGNSTGANGGAGGAGGGFGLWNFSYIKDSVHNVSVDTSGRGPETAGGNASFLFNGNGITAVGGPGGDSTQTSQSSSSTTGSPGGTLTHKYGGYGGGRNGKNGGN